MTEKLKLNGVTNCYSDEQDSTDHHVSSDEPIGLATIMFQTDSLLLSNTSFISFILHSMKLDFKKLTIDAKGVALEFSTGAINTISPIHFITLKREKLDIPTIESNVRSRYTEEISKGLFDEELANQMQEEIKNAVERRKQEIMNLPHPTIFTCTVAGFQNAGETTNFKVWVSDETAIYFIKNREDILHMEFNLETFPFYLEGANRAKEVLKYKDKFALRYPHTKPIQDCFLQYIATINSIAEFNKGYQKYEEPEYKREFDVVTTEDDQGNIHGEKCLLTLNDIKNGKTKE